MIQDSLFQAVTDAGERPELALELADIFGWDLDFYTDPQPGDTFSVVIEKKTARGEWRYGRRATGLVFSAATFSRIFPAKA